MANVNIRFLTSISGIGICLEEGDVESFPIEDAARFVRSRAADPHDEEAAAALEAFMGPAASATPEPERDPPAGQDPPAVEPDHLDAVTNPMSLKKIARDESIDIGEAKTAAEIRDAIRAARKAKAAS